MNYIHYVQMLDTGSLLYIHLSQSCKDGGSVGKNISFTGVDKALNVSSLYAILQSEESSAVLWFISLSEVWPLIPRVCSAQEEP